MADDGKNDSADGFLNRLTPKRPPWQIMVTGNAADPVSGAAKEALARIAEGQDHGKKDD